MTPTVEGPWAPFARALRDEFAGELAGPLACCEPGADCMFEHDGPCSLMEGPEVVETFRGEPGDLLAAAKGVDPALTGLMKEELQFAAHGEIFELYVQGEGLMVYTNGTRYRPEHEAQLEAVAPRAVAIEIHDLVREWICPCVLPDVDGYAARNPLADDVHWVWSGSLDGRSATTSR